MTYFNETNPLGDRSYAESVPAVSLEEAQKARPGWFSGTGDVFMTGLAETGRAIDLAGSVGPMAQDFFTGGTEHQDAYFREHDEVFNRAVDYWKPSPESVSASGQVVGGLLSGLTQFAAGGPGLMVGTAQLSTAEDLVREGNVSALDANIVGGIQGVATAIGVKAPFVGSTWARKALSGLAVNVPLGVSSRYLSHEVLAAQGADQAAAQFQALDPAGLATDILMPLVFSGVAQLGERGKIKAQIRDLTEPQKDAVLVANQAKHLELDTLPGVPLDGETVNAHVAAMTKAAEQMLRGEPVDVTAELQGAQFGEPRPAPKLDEALVPEPKQPPKLVDLPQPAEGAPKVELKTPVGETVTPEMRAAQQRLALGDIEIPTGEVDAQGNPVMQKATEALTAEPSLPAKAFQAAVTCFLGG